MSTNIHYFTCHSGKGCNALTICLISVLLLSACSVTAISPQTRNPEVPNQWQSRTTSDQLEQDWPASFADKELDKLIREALAGNYQLAQQIARLEESRLGVISSGADRFPEIGLGLSGSRRKTVNDSSGSNAGGGTGSISESYQASIDVSWELDIWGKLSDRQKQARLSWLAARAATKRAQQQLVADTARAWYQIIQASSLLDLFRQRLENVQQNLDIIDRGYRQGINNALDLYLTKDTLAQEQSRFAGQQQTLFDNTTQLQRILARYPSGQWPVARKLPVIAEPVPLGLPSELITRRPDIQQAWQNLLAADTGLAVAHKQRFPKLSLVGSVSDSSDALRRLLDGGSSAWSILGNLTQPLFQGRRLQAQERQAKAQVAQAEQQYLDQVFTAFAEVETLINEATTLQQRYQASLSSETNANSAYRLSFEQYRRGLVDYTTVLESQRRAFDSQTNIIQLRNQLIRNRIDLYLALGGDFAAMEEFPIDRLQTE